MTIARNLKAPWVVLLTHLVMSPLDVAAQGTDTGAGRQPLLVRGYTDVPNANIRLNTHGDIVAEIRVQEGQRVQIGDVVAVMRNYEVYDRSLKITEARRDLMRENLEALRDGPRVKELAIQEQAVKLTELTAKRAQIEIQRSALVPEIKQIDIETQQIKVEQEQRKLANMRAALDKDIRSTEAQLAVNNADVEHVRVQRDGWMIRSPINGLVLQIYTRPGEIPTQGIARIVDLSQIRVLADVDEVQVDRVKVGGAALISLRGEAEPYKGRVSRVVPSVNRLRRPDPEGATPMDARVVQVEVEFVDKERVPQIIGREVRVTLF